MLRKIDDMPAGTLGFEAVGEVQVIELLARDRVDFLQFRDDERRRLVIRNQEALVSAVERAVANEGRIGVGDRIGGHVARHHRV